MRSTYLAIDCGLWATIAGRQSHQQDGEYAIEMVHCEDVNLQREKKGNIMNTC